MPKSVIALSTVSLLQVSSPAEPVVLVVVVVVVVGIVVAVIPATQQSSVLSKVFPMQLSSPQTKDPSQSSSLSQSPSPSPHDIYAQHSSPPLHTSPEVVKKR